MNQKLLIVLFSTMLCNGVTYSSANEQFSVTKLSEEKLPDNSSVTGSIEKKVELALVNSTDHTVSFIQNTTSLAQHINQSLTLTTNNINQTTAQNSTDISIPIVKNITVNSSAEIVKNENQDSVIRNISKVVDNKTSSQTVENKNATSSNDVPADKNSSATPSGSTPSTSTIVNIKNNTFEKTTITPSASAVASTPALTTKVVTGQNTPAPAQEKHFDGPSFIGGIVLTIGLTAIGFIAFKYYKSGKIDMNYRTL